MLKMNRSMRRAIREFNDIFYVVDSKLWDWLIHFGIVEDAEVKW